jgi:hypothetical protein
MSANFGQQLIDTLLGFIPPLLVGGVFWLVMRSILGADKKERQVYSQIEAEERAKLAAAANIDEAAK